MRLFAALPLPEPVVERLTSFRLRFSNPKDGLRWTTPEQWHVTLQFYGEVDEDQAKCLQLGLVQITTGAPSMAVEGLGLFAAKGILFASMAATSSLLALQLEVQKKSSACGVISESRPFRPHITLARSKGRVGLKALRDVSTPTLPSLGAEMRWTAHDLVLLESILRPQGAEYLVKMRGSLRTTDTDSGRAV